MTEEQQRRFFNQAMQLARVHGALATIVREAKLSDYHKSVAEVALASGEAELATRNIGVEWIALERARQVEKEGYDQRHDDGHSYRDLVAAAICYAEHAYQRGWLIERPETFGPRDPEEAAAEYVGEPVPSEWPWNDEYWKPKDPRRDLVRAGALIAAALDRMVRPPPAPADAQQEQQREEAA